MTGWDVLSNLINGLPSIVATLVSAAAGVIFLIGFSHHGYNFLKYGFKQTEISDLGAKIDGLHTEIDGLRTEFKTDLDTKIDQLRTEFRTEMGGFKTELETIKVNHFGHLKNFLTELTSILVDKGVINNENKARLDNQLRGM
jgi:polyhydroxyalkanoate synthesis regulator phasin